MHRADCAFAKLRQRKARTCADRQRQYGVSSSGLGIAVLKNRVQFDEKYAFDEDNNYTITHLNDSTISSVSSSNAGSTILENTFNKMENLIFK